MSPEPNEYGYYEFDPDDWRPGCHGGGKRRWFVCKGAISTRYVKTKRGTVLKFGSYEMAQRLAVEMNRKAAT